MLALGRGPGALGWVALATALLVLLPVIAVFGNVFHPSTGTWAHLAATVLPEYLWTTVALVVGVAIGVACLGVGAAWLVATYRFPGHSVLEWALVLPLAMPAYVIAYVYTDWLQFTGPVQGLLRDLTGWQAGDYWFPDVRSLGGAILMFAAVLYPYVYLLVRTALVEQSAGALEAARLGGLTRTGVFFRVALPLARPAIVAGVSLALMETLADFGAVSYFGVQTLTTGIFRAWQSFGDIAAAAQLAMLLLFVVAAVLLVERANRGRARFQGSGSSGRRIAPDVLHGWRALLATLLCALPLVAGFLLPALLLARLASSVEHAANVARLGTIVGNSLILAGTAAVLAVSVALLLAYAARMSRHPAVAAANRVASLGYALPGAVLAVGILVPLAAVDNVIANWVRETFGARIGLLLTGSIVALVYAYVVRFLSIALHAVESGLTRITPSMDDAARSLGLAPRATLIKVHLPMLRGSALVALLLVFVDVMKELPATFALRPFNFDTLAIHIYNLAKDERLAEAALPSLIIVAVGLVPLVVLSRRMAGGGAPLPT